MNYVNKNKNIKKRTSLVPVRRMANTKEIAEHIYHLASEKNTYITLQKSVISGGE